MGLQGIRGLRTVGHAKEGHFNAREALALIAVLLGPCGRACGRKEDELTAANENL